MGVRRTVFSVTAGLAVVIVGLWHVMSDAEHRVGRSTYCTEGVGEEGREASRGSGCNNVELDRLGSRLPWNGALGGEGSACGKPSATASPLP